VYYGVVDGQGICYIDANMTINSGLDGWHCQQCVTMMDYGIFPHMARPSLVTIAVLLGAFRAAATLLIVARVCFS